MDLKQLWFAPGGRREGHRQATEYTGLRDRGTSSLTCVTRHHCNKDLDLDRVLKQEFLLLL